MSRASLPLVRAEPWPPGPPGPAGVASAGDLPRELYLEVTNRCNLVCKTCPQSWGMPEPFADMSLEQAKRVVDQLPRLDRVVLHGVGESIMNRALPDILRLVKGRGAYVLFNSNGTLLRQRNVEPLIEAGLDELRVSLDAAREETYEAVRGEHLLPRIIKNLRSVSALKQRRGALHPRLSLWMTGLRTNVGELGDLVRLAADLGIAEVYLQRLVTSERGLATREESLVTGAEIDESALVEAEALAAQLGVTLRGSGNATGARARPSHVDEAAPWRGCRRPYVLTYVTANGNVLPCCIAPFTSAPYGSYVLGNVFEQPLADVWQGERYQSWRQRLESGEPPEACRRCGTDWSL